MTTHTPEAAAARQVLFAACDKASKTGRTILFRAIAHLAGDTRPQQIDRIQQTWQATR